MIRRELLMAASIIAAVTTACSEPAAPAGTGSDGVYLKSDQGRALHLTKECSEYLGRAGDHCTVIKSNVKLIPSGSRVFYLSLANLVQGTYDGNVELRVSDGNLAFGHCTVFDLFATIANTTIGNCSFSGGVGQFEGFQAQIVVSVGLVPVWANWKGKYGFSD